MEALTSGYRVRVAVRSVSSAKSKLLNTISLSNSSHASNISFVEVPDILAPGAYTEVTKGVDFVIHCASPLPLPHLTDYEKQIVKPAITGTLELLEAAQKEPTVKRVVITSSVAGNRPFGWTGETVTTVDTRIPTPEGPFESAFEAYSASKAAALNAAEEWVDQHKPGFDVVHIMPAWVVGRNELASTTKELLTGTAGLPIIHLVAPESPMSKGRSGEAVDVRDVAIVHVRALETTKIQGNKGYGAITSVVWQDAFEMVKKHLPTAVDEGVFEDASVSTERSYWDGKETQHVFGVQFRSFEESTIDVAEQWLEVLGKTKA